MSFGPGPLTPAVRWLIYANVAIFVVSFVVPLVAVWLGLSPSAVLGDFWLWQPVTYMFVHRELFHILFNMLALWMFGVEIERIWGTNHFFRYYFVSGVGAGITTILVSLLPFAFAEPVYYSLTIGASGAIYGLLLAYGMMFPNRPIYIYFLFPIPARIFVLIMGAIAFLSSISASTSGVAHVTHLGGLIAGYLYLTMGRGGPLAELKYRWLKWKMARMRRKFDVIDGGSKRGGWDGKYH